VTAGSPVRPLPSRREARRLRGPSRLEELHSRSDNSEVIVCRGVLDYETCGELEVIIERALEGGVQRLRLDFAGLVMIDDAGLRCLRTTSQRCRESGAVFEVDAGGHVREAIAASGIEELADRPPDGGLT
jgi:anti-anti-sigma regulatory factor